MSGGPTIVVKFGESVADGEFFSVELDDNLNTNVPRGRILSSYILQGITYYVMYFGLGDIRTLPAEGVKSQFVPGDQVFFLMHYDHSRLRITDIKATSGQVVVQGEVSRSTTDEVLFTAAGELLQLSHIPVGGVSASWFGRSAAISRDGRNVSANAAPCLGNVSYVYQATSCRFVPPPMTLSDDDSYPVAIVVYVEAAE
jgi:hypothetical protein